jgi:hypothetical protein
VVFAGQTRIRKITICIYWRQKAFAIRANAIRERAAKRAPAGERERLVGANGIAVCLATFAMAFYLRNDSNFVLRCIFHSGASAR